MSNPLDDLLGGIIAPSILDPQDVLLPVVRVPLALPLYDFQEDAVEHALRGQGHTYVALDMGLGKTPVGITLAASAAAVRTTPVLIVVPPSLRFNWKREFAKFSPTTTVEVLEGAKCNNPDTWVAPSVDVLLMGDSQLAGWSEALAGKVRDFIVDEAHRLKNKSGRSKAMLQIAEACDGLRVLMSGTPTPNGRHSELVMQLDILGPDAWKNVGGKGKFFTHYAPIVDARFGTRKSENGAELHASLVSSFFFRRLRGDVLDMPAKGRTALAIDSDGKAKRDYIRAEDDLIQWLAEEGLNFKGAERAEALVRLTTLRRLAGASKVKGIITHVKEILEEAPGGVFVVAEHKDTIDAIMAGLSKYNPVAVRGGQSDKQKSDNVDDFCDGTSRVMVGQITAAGVGLTLHGGGLNHRVIIAQLPWTPADLRQAEDRLHRIGQTNDVEVEVCMAAIEGRWTIDERLWGQLEAKAFAAGEIADGEGEVLLEEVVAGVLDSYR